MNRCFSWFNANPFCLLNSRFQVNSYALVAYVTSRVLVGQLPLSRADLGFDWECLDWGTGGLIERSLVGPLAFLQEDEKGFQVRERMKPEKKKKKKEIGRETERIY